MSCLELKVVIIMFKWVFTLFIVVAGAFLPLNVFASGGGGEEKKAVVDAHGKPMETPVYVPFRPPLTVNYGGSGRVKYIKADISLRMKDEHAADAVRHHMPLLRNNLMLILAAQTDEGLNAPGGKEALRQAALKSVREVITQEEKHEGVVDLYFNSLLIQD
jgi:flagellar protein FliL